jgi:bla regulator protein BlaR1
MTAIALHALAHTTAHLIAQAAPALGNHLWQTTAFAALAALLTLALRGNQARTRHCIWLAASLKFLLPLALLATLGSHFAKPHPRPIAQVTIYTAVEDFSDPFLTQPIPAPPINKALPTPTLAETLLRIAPLACASLWLAGFVTILVAFAIRWRRVANSMRPAQPLTEGREIEILRRLESAANLRHPTPLLLSHTQMEPGVFGIFRPVLAWPAGLSQRLDDAQLEAVLAHEVAHIRRRDNLTAAIHMLVQAAFWFHPIVWWIGARMVAERERACDEAVLDLCPQPEAYAYSILQVCAFCVESPLACVSGITGADLKQRVLDIMTARVARRLTLAKKLLLAAAALCTLAVPILLAQAKATERMMAMIATPPQKLLPAFLQASSSGIAAAPASTASAAAHSFASATIHASGPAATRRNYGFQITPAGEFVSFAIPLQELISFALADGQRVSGGPAWAQTDAYDIDAKLAPADLAGWDTLPMQDRMQRIRPLLRTLIEQRFQLKTHSDMEPTPVYVLLQAKGGAKLTEVPAPPPVDPTQPPTVGTADDPAPGSAMTMAGFTAHAVKIGSVLGQLGYEMSSQDKPIIDQTGLTGYYDFTLKLIKEDGGPTSEKQMEDQLGLRLEARTIPMKTLLIDSAARPQLDPPNGKTMQVEAVTPPPPPHIHFDVVSFKPCSPDKPGSGKVDMPMGGDYIAYHCRPIHNVIYFAFAGQTGFQLGGQPDWVEKDLYDFEAKVAPEDIAAWKKLTIDQRRLTVRDLLADELKLKMHVDKTPQPAYALVVAKGGPHLTDYKYGEQWKIPDGRILEGRMIAIIDTTRYFQNTKMMTFAANLTEHLDRPVVDQTGLDGNYDVSIPMTQAAVNLSPFADIGDGVTLSSGLEVLGLKLVPTKIETDGLVLDSIERPVVN